MLAARRVDVGELVLLQLLAVLGVQLGHVATSGVGALHRTCPDRMPLPIPVPLTVEQPFHIVLGLMRTSVRFPARTSLAQILEGLASDSEFQEMVTRWERLPARPARYAEFPEWL